MPAPRLRSGPCPLCGGDKYRVEIEAPDLSSRELEVYRVVRCSSCGLLRTDPALIREDYKLAYSDEYAPHKEEPVRFSTPSGFAAGLRRIDFQRSVCGRHVADAGPLMKLLAAAFGRTRRGNFIRFWFPGEGRRVLDVGCGAGGLAWMLRGMGWSSSGVEIDEAAAARARERGLEVVTGDFSAKDIELPDDWEREGFDVVSFHHSLEHMADPVRALRRARRLLKPKGAVYAAVPNAAAAMRKEFGPYWYPLDLPRHHVHFEPVTLKQALASAGLKTMRTHQTFSVKSVERSLEAARSKDYRVAGWIDSMAGRPRMMSLALKLMEIAGRGDNLHCYAVGADSKAKESNSVYAVKGAYHWRETEGGLREYNAFLAARYKFIFAKAIQIPPTTCVEIGCGDGRLSAMLRDAGHRVMGVDVDSTGLKLAGKRSVGADFAMSDAVRLPFATGSVGLVVAADVIEHLPDGDALIDEIRRIMSERGLALITTPNRQATGPADSRHHREWSAYELRRDLKRSFGKVEVCVTHPAVWHRIYRARILGRELLRTPINWLARRLGINPFSAQPGRRADGLQLVASCRRGGLG